MFRSLNLVRRGYRVVPGPQLLCAFLLSLVVTGAAIGCHEGPPAPNTGTGGGSSCSSVPGEVTGTFGVLEAPPGDAPLRPDGGAGESAGGVSSNGGATSSSGAAANGDEAQEAFRPLQNGEDVYLQWGSQLGMGLPIVLRLGGAAADQCSGVDLELLIEGDPIGLDTQEPPELTCSNGSLYLNGMIMVDVGMHPTVTSVAQLDGRDAVVRFVAREGAEVLASGELPIILHL